MDSNDKHTIEPQNKRVASGPSGAAPAKKVYLMILDGFGEGKDYPGNAVTHARMPNLNHLRKEYPLTLLQAHGESVGLPAGTMGGSEVGHFTIGAGRIVFQTLEEINRSIRSGDFYKKPALLEACRRVNNTEKSALHLLGMISDAGVHSHLDHLFALLKLAKDQGVIKTYIHAITDGRDVPEKCADKYIKMIHDKIREMGMGPGSKTEAKIATIIGRYYAMDRDKNWDRTKTAYDLYTQGKGHEETDPLEALKHAYARGAESDYYIDAIILDRHGEIKNKDSVIFWNFRTDRTRQITECFTGESEVGFLPVSTPAQSTASPPSPDAEIIVRPFFVCFGDYSKVAPVVFPTPVVKNNLGSVIEQQNLKQLRIAETEKYAHVTYFFNSQVEEPFKNEDRIMIPSPKTPSYAQVPQMSAKEITDDVIREIEKNEYALIVQNFANPDLVGHSGDFKATVAACEFVDECLGRIVAKTLEKGYDLIITADHGNAEYKIYEENGEPCPSHSKNPVIFLPVSPRWQKAKLRDGGGLKDIAPTILKMLDIPQPPEMTGESLL
jgi:2,3-bisphosphoglycerate-independent phosphoglycerate mutase